MVICLPLRGAGDDLSGVGPPLSPCTQLKYIHFVKGTQHRQNIWRIFLAVTFLGFPIFYPGDMDCNSYNFLRNINNIFHVNEYLTA